MAWQRTSSRLAFMDLHLTWRRLCSSMSDSRSRLHCPEQSLLHHGMLEGCTAMQAAEVRQAFASYEAKAGAKPRGSTHAPPPTGSPGHMPIPRAPAPSVPATQHPPLPAPVSAPVTPAPREPAAVAPVARHPTHTAPLSAPIVPESRAKAMAPASGSDTMHSMHGAPIAAQSAQP